MNKTSFSFLFIGILIGITIMLLWIYLFEISFLNHIRIENIEFGINETKIVDYIISTINNTN